MRLPEQAIFAKLHLTSEAVGYCTVINGEGGWELFAVVDFKWQRKYESLFG